MSIGGRVLAMRTDKHCDKDVKVPDKAGGTKGTTSVKNITNVPKIDIVRFFVDSANN